MPTKCFKFLGHLIDENLSWKYHIEHVHNKLSSANYALARSKNFLPVKIRHILYHSIFAPHLEYGILAWGGARKTQLKSLFILQKKALRNIEGASARAHSDPLFFTSGILKLGDLSKFHSAIFMYKYMNELLPASFRGMFQHLTEPNRTRNVLAARPRNSKLEKFPNVTLPKIWNELPTELKCSETMSIFKNVLKKLLINSYNNLN